MRLVKDAIVASLVSSTLSFRVMFRFQKLGKGESEKGRGGGRTDPKIFTRARRPMTESWKLTAPSWKLAWTVRTSTDAFVV